MIHPSPTDQRFDDRQVVAALALDLRSDDLSDELAPVRGVLLGAALSLPLWAAVGAAVWYVLR